MTRTRQPVVPLLFLIAGLAGVGMLGGVALWGADYFTLPAPLRPAHPRHALLRSSGDLGLLCGLLGTALFILNLTYLLRKRLPRARAFGSLRSWMAFHVFTGLTGSALIVLHSSFMPRSSLGILALSGLGIVVVTGLMGRYIYAHVPRSLEGHELRADELRRRLDAQRQRLAAAGLDADLLDLSAGTSPVERPDRGLLGSLWGVIAGDRELHRRIATLRTRLWRDPRLRVFASQLLPLAGAYVRDQQRLARYSELRSLMASWRFLHRWLAIVMIALIVFHVILAMRLGNLHVPFGHYWPLRELLS